MRCFTSKSIFLCILFSALTLSACDEDSSDSRVPGEGACSPDCVAGEICNNGRCEKQEPVENACDPGCTDGYECKGGKCEPVHGTADECNSSCDEDQVCKEGRCEPIVAEVDECDNSCGENQVCKDGKCADESRGDASDCSPACAGGMICSDGECIDDEDAPDPGDGDDDVDPADPGAFLVTPNTGLVTYQGKGSATFVVSLSQAPQKTVTIPVASDNKDAGTLSVSKVVFTPEQWNTPQAVTITGATKALAKESVTYKVTVGPSISEDSLFDKMEKVVVPVTHYSTESLPDESTLTADSKELLLMGSPVVITANFSNTEDLKWKVEISKGIAGDKASVNELVKLTKVSDNSQMLSSVVDMTNDGYRAHKLDLSRTVKVTVTGKNVSKSIEIELKPYIGLNYNLTNLRKIRDLNTPGHRNVTPKTGAFEKGEMGCGYYDENTTHVLTKDMVAKYVSPNVYSYGGSNYGTRASVLAAARFLVVQFPKDIPYTSGLMYDNEDNAVKTVPPTIGRYVWTTFNYDKNVDRSQVRLFGFNLTGKGMNSFSSFKDDNVIIGGKGQDKLYAWGCPVKTFQNKDITYEGEKVVNPYNGLRCSGFVNWSLNNGRFYLSDWNTALFSKNGRCKIDGKVERNYKCKSLVYDTQKQSNGSLYHWSNANGQHLKVFEKMNELKESDFVEVNSLTEESDIKAGDLLWYGTSTKCPKDGDGNCPTIDKCTEGGGGHVAMIIGISRNSDKNRTINKVYVAEATGRNGNHLTAYTIDSLKERWMGKVTKGEKAYCSIKDSRVIKMDNVYNYFYNKKKSDPAFLKGLNGKDFNTYNYTELWF